MALAALAKYNTNEYPKVQAFVNKAVEGLSKAQSSNGSYGNVNSDAMVIIGLTAIGIDPATNARFVKGGCSWRTRSCCMSMMGKTALLRAISAARRAKKDKRWPQSRDSAHWLHWRNLNLSAVIPRVSIFTLRQPKPLSPVSPAAPL